MTADDDVGSPAARMVFDETVGGRRRAPGVTMQPAA